MFRRKKATFKVVVHGISEENPHTVNLPHKVRTRARQANTGFFTHIPRHTPKHFRLLLARFPRSILCFQKQRSPTIFYSQSYLCQMLVHIWNKLANHLLSRLFARNCKEMQTGVRGRDQTCIERPRWYGELYLIMKNNLFQFSFIYLHNSLLDLVL